MDGRIDARHRTGATRTPTVDYCRNGLNRSNGRTRNVQTSRHRGLRAPITSERLTALLRPPDGRTAAEMITSNHYNLHVRCQCLCSHFSECSFSVESEANYSTLSTRSVAFLPRFGGGHQSAAHTGARRLPRPFAHNDKS